MSRIKPLSRICAVAIIMFTALAAQSAQHPLDPLSGEEISKTVDILRTAGHINDDSRFPIITLKAPSKADVLAWKPGMAMRRIANAMVRSGPRVYEADVDLSAGKVARWAHKEGVESPIMLEEWSAAQQIALADERMIAGLKKRDITHLDKLFCAPFTMGNFNIPEDQGKRLLKVGCFDVSHSTNNIFMAPIEGLYAVVDLHAKSVHKVWDSGVVPVSKANLNFTEASQANLRAPLKPVTQHQPLGQNVTVNGHQVSWQNWSFHVHIDRRVGTVMSQVTYNDKGKPRSVLYQGMMSEMFVPYMDPDYGWYSRTYFDVGEYGAGLLASVLHAGIDCPQTATFLSVSFNDDKGKPYTMPNAICIFERAAGEPVWRHAEFINETYEGRPSVDLVVRMASQIGNYDYLIDWVFKLTGEIDVMVGSTGIDALKGVAAETMSSPTAAEDTAYGTLVAPNLVAINHDHYFSFRLDFDVDGQKNSFVKYSLKPQRLPAASPRRSIYTYEQEIPQTDTQARLNRHPGPTMFAVFNPSATNAVGNRTAYQIVPLSHAKMMLGEDEPAVKRAAFTQHDFWVTPYDENERYASGDYVFGSTGDDGLGVWTSRHRPVVNTDIVVWHTVGMHHMTRAEDIPVMSVNWKGMRLRPLNFFDQNPALDLRRHFAQPQAKSKP
jgi:primary-amine oxidase